MYLEQFTIYMWSWNMQTNMTFNPTLKVMLVCIISIFLLISLISKLFSVVILYTVMWPVYVTEPTWTFNNFWQTARIRQKFIPSVENDYVVKSSQFPSVPYSHKVWGTISDNIKWTALVLSLSIILFSHLV